MFFWRLAVGDWCGAFLSKVRINEQSPRIQCGEIAREKALGLLGSCFNYLMSVVSFMSTSLPFLS